MRPLPSTVLFSWERTRCWVCSGRGSVHWRTVTVFYTANAAYEHITIRPCTECKGQGFTLSGNAGAHRFADRRRQETRSRVFRSGHRKREVGPLRDLDCRAHPYKTDSSLCLPSVCPERKACLFVPRGCDDRAPWEGPAEAIDSSASGTCEAPRIFECHYIHCEGWRAEHQ